MEIENEHIRKLNEKLKHDKSEAFDSRTLFPHVFRQENMPMYVLNSYITSVKNHFSRQNC